MRNQKYGCRRIGEGDYLVPSNDLRYAYRVSKYREDPHGRASWRWQVEQLVNADGTVHVGPVEDELARELARDIIDGERRFWEIQSDNHRTKQEALDSLFGSPSEDGLDGLRSLLQP